MNLIEKRRKKLNYKVYELANKINIDASLMSRILSGDRTPTDNHLRQLSEILSIDYEDLLKEKMSSEVTDILYRYPEIAEDVFTGCRGTYSFFEK